MNEPSSREQVDEIRARLAEASNDQMQEKVLGKLVESYGQDVDEETAGKIRQDFLDVLEEHPSILESDQFVRFLIEEIDAADLAEIQWKDPDKLVTIYEGIYSTPFTSEDTAGRATSHMQELMRSVLRQLEARNQIEKIFQLLQTVSVSTADDPELKRLHDRAKLHERRRVGWHRRILYGYLLLQVVLIGVVFPLLFIEAENGRLQRRIENLTETEIQQKDVQFLSYGDGVYWAFITAGSIGYGDITPQTSIGRGIAATLGILGVITVGVIAGLILDWITPRKLE